MRIPRLPVTVFKVVCFTFVILICSLENALGQRPHVYEGNNSINRLLSSTQITSLTQDKKGYLWIGTDDGLNRYDGNSVVIYKNNPDDSTSIQDNFVRSLTVDPEGNLWAGHGNGRISIYDQSSGTFHNINGPTLGLANDGVSKIFFDKAGGVWVCVVRNGLFRYEKTKNRFLKISDLNDIDPAYKRIPKDFANYNSIYDMYDEGTGIIWLSTHDGLYQYDQKTKKLNSVREKKVVPFKWRYDLFGKILHSDDGLWMTSWGGGLTFYNTKTHEWKKYKPVPDQEASSNYNIIMGIEWKEKDQLWISGTDYGLGYFDIKKEKFVFYNTQLCQRLLKDKTGLLWTASEIEGVTQFDPVNSLSFQRVNVSHTDNQGYYFTSSFYHDKKKRLLYFGVTYGDGFHVYNEATGEERAFGFETLKNTDRTLEIHSILKDDRDTLWVLTRDFIYIFDENRQQLKKFKQPIKGSDSHKEITPDYFQILRALNGDLWMSTSNNGLYKFDHHKKVYINFKANDKNGLTGSIYQELAEDNLGRIWVLTEKGISVYDNSTGVFTNYLGATSESKKIYIQDIAKTPNGDIWIGANDGLYQYDHASNSIRFKHWTYKDGLPPAKIHSIKSDNKGGIWMLNTSGLYHLDPTKGKITPTAITPTFITTSAFHVDEDGVLYVGNYAGYNKYNVKSQFGAPGPSLVLTSFRVNNNEILRGELKEQNLKYYQNAITIEFAALDFRDPAKIKYSYCLEGLDTKWTTHIGQHLANYENLPTGNFTFKVKAANPEGIWSEPIQVRIYIAPPFWGTWYFKTAIVLFLVGIAYLFYRWRILKVRDEEKLKSHFSKRILELEMRSLRAQMNPHFIFNSLNSINKFIVMADPETASFYLTKFSRLIRLILENSRQPRISLEQDLTALTHYIELELLRFDHHFSYLIDIDPSLDPTSTQIPPLIIQPYVENSIWHGFAKKDLHGKLTISVFKENDQLLVITIEDNGVGRAHQKTQLSSNNTASSRGLKLTEDRLKIHSHESNGISSVDILDLKNEKGEATGTKVTIRVATKVISKTVLTN